MKTAIYSTREFERDYLEAARAHHKLILVPEEISETNLSLAAGCKAVSIGISDHLTDRALEKLAEMGIAYITLRSAGYDYINLEKAHTLGLKIARVPVYSPYAIAEHAVMLLLALNRKLIHSQELIQKGDFRIDSLTGFDVHGKTVGIVGLGKIGQAFAAIMKGFGCKILVYDVNPDPSLEKKLGIEYVTFGEICRLSDIISIHCPFNNSTHHLFDRHAFCLMKPTVILINTARGAIINTDDLLKFLEKGNLGAVGLDVYEYEKGLFAKKHETGKVKDERFGKLREFSNVLITAHQAFLTDTALRNIAGITMQNLSDFEKTGSSQNEIK